MKLGEGESKFAEAFARRPKVGMGIAPVLAMLLFGSLGAEIYCIRTTSSALAAVVASVLAFTTLFPFINMIGALLTKLPSPRSMVDAPRRHETPVPETRLFELFNPPAFAHEIWLASHEYNKCHKATRAGTKVIFIGDSLMANWSVVRWGHERCLLLACIWIPQAILFWVWMLAAAFVAQAARVKLLAKLLSFLDSPHELMEAMEGANCGIQGDRTRHLLWRIRHGELERAPPSVEVVWCLIGLNDFKFRECGKDEVADGIVACAKELEARLPNHVRIVVQALLPWQGEVETDPQLVKETNEATEQGLRNVCSARVRFIDLACAMCDEHGTFSTKLFSDDAHPNEAGYQAWGKAMMPIVKAKAN